MNIVDKWWESLSTEPYGDLDYWHELAGTYSTADAYQAYINASDHELDGVQGPRAGAAIVDWLHAMWRADFGLLIDRLKHSLYNAAGYDYVMAGCALADYQLSSGHIPSRQAQLALDALRRGSK